MNINIIIIILILILYLFIKMIPIHIEKKNKLFINIAFAILLVILLIRKPISDMENYFNYFIYLKNASLSQFFNFSLEFMYKVLNVVIAKIWFNKRFFMFIVDILTTLGAYICIKKYSKNYLITLLLFTTIGTYYMQFFILRQAIAIGILLYSIKYIENKKLFKFLFCVVFATLFHKSSIIFILAYWVCNFKFNLKYFSLWLGIWIITFFYRSAIANFFMQYAHKEYNNMAISNEGYGRLVIFIGILSLAIFIDYFMKRKNKTTDILEKRESKDQKSIFYNLTLMTISFQIVATQNDFFCRISNMFCIGPVILLPNLIYELKNENSKKILNMISIIVIIIYAILRSSILGYLTILQ